MLADLDSLEKRRREPRQEGQGAATRKPSCSSTWSSKALELLRRRQACAPGAADAEEERGCAHAAAAHRQAGALRLQRRRGRRRRATRYSRRWREHAKAEGAGCVVISAKIEAEMAELSARGAGRVPRQPRARASPASTALIRAGYDLLGLITYFTVGPKEARAWTMHRGATAPQAAGVIHTDFEKGFIRAETIAYDDYVELGGEPAAKEAGKLRLEGKEYVVQDGDVMHFRFAN